MTAKKAHTLISFNEHCVMLTALKHNTTNKKNELMLMKRVRAYSSSCLQVILVYLQTFHRNFHPFAAKKSIKINTFRVQGHRC